MVPNEERVVHEPAELDIPPEMAEILAALTDEGRSDFIAELFASLTKAKATNSLTPVQTAIDAWHRSMVIAQRMKERHGGTDGLLDWETEVMENEPPLSPEEIREILQV